MYGVDAVELQPGDVLYVPKHWWHFASSVDVTVSVNQWVDVPSGVDGGQCARFFLGEVATVCSILVCLAFNFFALCSPHFHLATALLSLLPLLMVVFCGG